MTFNKKLLSTLLLFFFTTSFFEGMIIKSLATCQGPSRQKHIKFVMTLTGGPFQVCFAIVGQNPVYLTLFILHEQCYSDLLFVLVSIFYLHGNFEGSTVGRGSLQFFLIIDAGQFSTVSWGNWFVLQSFFCARVILHVFDY